MNGWRPALADSSTRADTLPPTSTAPTTSTPSSAALVFVCVCVHVLCRDHHSHHHPVEDIAESSGSLCSLVTIKADAVNPKLSSSPTGRDATLVAHVGCRDRWCREVRAQYGGTHSGVPPAPARIRWILLSTQQLPGREHIRSHHGHLQVCCVRWLGVMCAQKQHSTGAADGLVRVRRGHRVDHPSASSASHGCSR